MIGCVRYLITEIADGAEVVSEVLGSRRRFLFIKLFDLQLKLPVVSLQRAHLHTRAEEKARPGQTGPSGYKLLTQVTSWS